MAKTSLTCVHPLSSNLKPASRIAARTLGTTTATPTNKSITKIDGLDVKHKYHVRTQSGGLLSLERSQPFSHCWRIRVQLGTKLNGPLSLFSVSMSMSLLLFKLAMEGRC